MLRQRCEKNPKLVGRYYRRNLCTEQDLHSADDFFCLSLVLLCDLGGHPVLRAGLCRNHRSFKKIIKTHLTHSCCSAIVLTAWNGGCGRAGSDQLFLTDSFGPKRLYWAVALCIPGGAYVRFYGEKRCRGREQPLMRKLRIHSEDIPPAPEG